VSEVPSIDENNEKLYDLNLNKSHSEFSQLESSIFDTSIDANSAIGGETRLSVSSSRLTAAKKNSGIEDK
jgi:hypothetical protein